MKKTFILLLMSMLMAVSAFAQDVIVKRNGDEIKAIVKKVSDKEVEYKKWTNQSGPTYTIAKNDVFMIKYKNGTKDVFEETKPVVAPPVQQPQPKQEPQNTNVQLSGNGYSIGGVSSTRGGYAGLANGNNGDRYLQKDDLLRRARVNKMWSNVCIVSGAALAATPLVLTACDVDCGPWTYVMIIGGIGICTAGGGMLSGIAQSQRTQANAIKVASVYDKDIDLGKGKKMQSGIKMMNVTTGNKHDLALGVGATISF